VFAGRRHVPQTQQDGQQQQILEKLAKFIEDQARLKFQQQIHQQHQNQHIPQEITGPGFSFLLPPMTKAEFNRGNDEPIQFAVKPFDPRYYENNENEEAADEFEENPSSMSEDVNNFEPPAAEGSNKILIPPPMHVNGNTDKILHRAQQKLARNQQQQQQEVMQKPLQVEFDNTMSLYIVALIAGLSCAFSTGVSYTQGYRNIKLT
jgi:hypothetical protein